MEWAMAAVVAAALQVAALVAHAAVQHNPAPVNRATMMAMRRHPGAMPSRAMNPEASHAMTSTTSSPRATHPPDSRLPANPPATAATSVAAAPAAARVVLVAETTGLVGRAVLARLLADKH